MIATFDYPGVDECSVDPGVEPPLGGTKNEETGEWENPNPNCCYVAPRRPTFLWRRRSRDAVSRYCASTMRRRAGEQRLLLLLRGGGLRGFHARRTVPRRRPGVDDERARRLFSPCMHAPPRSRRSLGPRDRVYPTPPAPCGTANSRTRRHTHRRSTARRPRRGRKEKTY